MLRLCPCCAAKLDLPDGQCAVVACPPCKTRFMADTRQPDDPMAHMSQSVRLKLDVRQGSRDWLELRRTMRMASETPAVLGLSPYSNALKNLRAQKHGQRLFVNPAMRKGTEQEPAARAAYEAAHGAAVDRESSLEGSVRSDPPPAATVSIIPVGVVIVAMAALTLLTRRLPRSAAP
jgi:hypothetical protein